MKMFPRSVAYSLGAHGLALAMLLIANANAVAPGRAPETIPFIRASLIYAMSAHSMGQGASALPIKATERKVRAENRAEEPRLSIPAVVGKAAPDAAETKGVRMETAGYVEGDVPVSLNPPSSGGNAVREIAGREGASGTRSGVGQPGEQEKAEAPQVALPRYLDASRPPYPWIARMKGYEGMVLLAVEVLTDGRAGRIRIKKSSGYALLDQSALNAVRDWRFEPARKSSTPLAMTVDIPVRFSLAESD